MFEVLTRRASSQIYPKGMLVMQKQAKEKKRVKFFLKVFLCHQSTWASQSLFLLIDTSHLTWEFVRQHSWLVVFLINNTRSRGYHYILRIRWVFNGVFFVSETVIPSICNLIHHIFFITFAEHLKRLSHLSNLIVGKPCKYFVIVIQDISTLSLLLLPL